MPYGKSKAKAKTKAKGKKCKKCGKPLSVCKGKY